jgi:hypothetical protein
MPEPTTTPSTTGPAPRRGATTRTATGRPARTPRPRKTVAAPADAADGPADLRTSRDPAAEVATRLAAELAAARADTTRPLTAKVEAKLLSYRPDKASDALWADVADLMRLGIAAHRPRTAKEVTQVGWALHVHSQLHHGRGTSRTVTGWYGADTVEATVDSGGVGTAGARSIATRLTPRR